MMWPRDRPRSQGEKRLVCRFGNDSVFNLTFISGNLKGYLFWGVHVDL